MGSLIYTSVSVIVFICLCVDASTRSSSRSSASASSTGRFSEASSSSSSCASSFRNNGKQKAKCGVNEMLNKCTNRCDNDSCPKNVNGQNKKVCISPAVCGPPQCQCIQNYKRDLNGVCIPIGKCPEICSTNEEYSNCTQNVNRTQNCTQMGNSPPCLNFAKRSCEAGCVCKQGTLRNSLGDCVPEDQCDGILICNDNETVDKCPIMCNDFCPTSEDSNTCSITDPTPPTCGPPVCKCRFNFKRDNNNKTCIPTRDCPPFDCSARPNEEYVSCPPICPRDDCSQATPSGRCPIFGRIGIVLECNPKCRCIQGYWRREDGICVPYQECPGICPENEEFSNCTQSLCRGENCTQLGQEIECPLEVASCNEGCVCVEGTLRADNGSCIPEDQCPAGLCPENEEFSNCTQSLCRGENCTQLGQEIECPLEVASCNEGCVCVEGTLRADNGSCILEDQCPDFTWSRPPQNNFI